MSVRYNLVMKDTLYASPINNLAEFSFDKKVVDVFPDMIQRSVPGYPAILAMISDISERYAQPESNCYDLGCSLGAATLAIRQGIEKQANPISNCQIIGVDNSPAMISRCESLITLDTKVTPIELRLEDISHTLIENASIVILNFTLQFIPPEERHTILKNIFNGLLPGGVVLISEKIHFEDQAHQTLMTELYHNFKRLNGYSDLEIAQKRTALENVLRSDSINTHQQRLKQCGFSSVDVWFQCFNFCSMIAIKE